MKSGRDGLAPYHLTALVLAVSPKPGSRLLLTTTIAALFCGARKRAVRPSIATNADAE